MNKQWVAVLFQDGRKKVWADYGNYAWGSPIYTVIGYYSNRKDAFLALKEMGTKNGN